MNESEQERKWGMNTLNVYDRVSCLYINRGLCTLSLCAVENTLCWLFSYCCCCCSCCFLFVSSSFWIRSPTMERIGIVFVYKFKQYSKRYNTNITNKHPYITHSHSSFSPSASVSCVLSLIAMDFTIQHCCTFWTTWILCRERDRG